jgi:hypothetical protein
MAETNKGPASTAFASYGELFLGIIAVLVFAVLWYFGFGALTKIAFFAEYPHAIKYLQYGAFVWAFVAVAGGAGNFFEIRSALRARNANAKVADALDRIKDTTPVAEISTQTVADSLKGTKVDDAQLARLVEQRKQILLIDDDYFREELRTLIVDYLQPLPRNAKRLLNRFRINLLIAHSRGLLTSEPKVSAQQIGKWLVLMERWPQLGRALSTVRQKMKVLEEQSDIPPEKPKIAEPAAQPASPPSSAPQAAPPDPFMQTVKLLAEPYLGDEDLRKFIHSDPSLAIVLPRLVHYGSDRPMATVTWTQSRT